MGLSSIEFLEVRREMAHRQAVMCQLRAFPNSASETQQILSSIPAIVNFELWIFSPGDFKWRGKQWRFGGEWRRGGRGGEHHTLWCNSYLWGRDHDGNWDCRAGCTPTAQEGNESQRWSVCISLLMSKSPWHYSYNIHTVFTYIITSLKKQE